MPMYGYYTNKELEDALKNITDNDVRVLAREIHDLNPKFYIAEYTRVKTHWFKRATVTYAYHILMDVGHGEAQILNIDRTKGAVIAYMYGYINGRRNTEGDSQ